MILKPESQTPPCILMQVMDSNEVGAELGWKRGQELSLAWMNAGDSSFLWAGLEMPSCLLSTSQPLVKINQKLTFTSPCHKNRCFWFWFSAIKLH